MSEAKMTGRKINKPGLRNCAQPGNCPVQPAHETWPARTSKLLNARGQKRAKNARGQPVGSIHLLAYDAGLPESPI